MKPFSSLLNHVLSQAWETKSPDGGGEAGTEDVRLGNKIRDSPFSGEEAPAEAGQSGEKRKKKEKKEVGRRRGLIAVTSIWMDSLAKDSSREAAIQGRDKKLRR